MSDAQTPKARRWSWLWIALIASLAINLAVVAAIVAHNAVGPHRHRSITGPGFTQILPRAFFRELDRDRRDELVGELRGHRKGFRALRKALREKARDVASALRAEPYDEAEVAKALAVYETEAQTMVGRGRNIAENFFRRLTPDERKQIADQIERKTMSKRRWKRWKHERKE
ncbi:periplasmic heavy metal sensor [Anderseniella sp. Alg231-50]|uniref:periplasmic heavy metal sensor n=1 Tax=Anderseniella sp. Alg231-50 TaxID=1922226 RepID=UPI000D560DA1